MSCMLGRVLRILGIGTGMLLAISLAVSASSLTKDISAGSGEFTSLVKLTSAINSDSDADWDASQAGFFDWFEDLFDWWNDAEDSINDVTDEVGDYLDPPYDNDGIPSDAFYADLYGMNMHNIDQLSVEDYETSLSYAGEWVRINISTDEVADQNWDYRLQNGLDNIYQAGSNLGISPKVVISFGGYSSHTRGGTYLLESLSWEEKASRYESLSHTLASTVSSWGYNDVIYESWNEPDNYALDMGIGLTTDDAGFVDALSTLNNAFANGIKSAGGTTAFSPFMSFNDSKYDTVKAVWERTQSGFDYFSTHMYDDEPGSARYWAEQVVNFIGDRPVLVTEHGYQNDKRNHLLYRQQAWAFYQGFTSNGQSTLAGVMGYVYGSDHSEWVIGSTENFLWEVTHDSQPQSVQSLVEFAVMRY